MKKIVIKFGGSNLKKPSDIQNIINIVKEYNRPLVIVVSAFYGITDYLLEKMESSGVNEIGRSMRFLRDLKSETLDKLNISTEGKERILDLVETRLIRLEELLKGIHYIGEVPDSVKDHVLSFGERLSSLVLSELFSINGIESCERLPEEIGFYTNGDKHQPAIDFEKSKDKVNKALKDDFCSVIPGFYGISPQGKPQLLGRGGSDYSGAAIARCIEAESFDVWKDVNGYMTANPALVPDARPINVLSYHEAAELSYFGAKILHPRTVEPLEEPEIPVRIFNVYGPIEDLKPRTLIAKKSGEPEVRSVTYNDDFSIIKIYGAGVGMKAGIISKIAGTLEKNNINIKSIVTSQILINIYLNSNDLEKAEKALGELKGDTIQQIKAVDNISIIAVVGKGISTRSDIAEKMIAGLMSQNIEYQIISLGASDSAAYCVIPKESRTKALQAVHQTFFKGENQESIEQ